MTGWLFKLNGFPLFSVYIEGECHLHLIMITKRMGKSCVMGTLLQKGEINLTKNQSCSIVSKLSRYVLDNFWNLNKTVKTDSWGIIYVTFYLVSFSWLLYYIHFSYCTVWSFQVSFKLNFLFYSNKGFGSKSADY